MKTVLLTALGELLLAAIVLLAALAPGDDTMYPAGYSEVEYRAIRAGDTADEVIRRLGPPLYISRDHAWGYALPFHHASVHVRELVFDSKRRVARKDSHFIGD